MYLPVLWTEEAKETFDAIVNAIEAQWGFQSAASFVSKTNSVIL